MKKEIEKKSLESTKNKKIMKYNWMICLRLIYKRKRENTKKESRRGSKNKFNN